MKKIILLLLFYLFISINIFSNVKEGFIDLTDYNFILDKPIDLSGEWLFEKNHVISFSSVPGYWKGGKGSVKYTLKIKSNEEDNLILAPSQIKTEFQFYLNSSLVSIDYQNRPMYIPIVLENGENILEFYINNNVEKFGGFRGRPLLGNFSTMIQLHESMVLRDSLIIGASIIMSIFFLFLFINYKNERSTLYFSLLCLFLSLRGFVSNEKIIFSYFPNISYIVINKLEYLSIYTVSVLTLLFVYEYYKKRKFTRLYRILIGLGLALVIITLLTPPKVYISFLYFFYLYVFLGSILIFITLIRYIKEGKDDCKKIFFSILILSSSSALDAIFYVNNITDFQTLPSSMIIFILIMSFIISKREIRRLKSIEELSDDNIKVIRYLNKFVPNGFIKNVGMGNITEIKRGDGVEKNMTVLFTSICDFKKELKLFKAEDCVNLLNRCYKIISPIITAHGGFIDKFIDETVMALFPGRPEDAINAVLEINRTLDTFNKEYIHGKPIHMRSGIHRGQLFIGIVGDRNRIDATVISKVVNTASRINSFTSKIGQNILISEEVLDSLSDPEIYKTMYMGRVKLKGKNRFIGIHSVYQDRVHEADSLFSITMKKLENSTLDKVENVLINIKQMHKDHKPSLYYLDLIKNNKKLEDLEK